MNRWLRPRNITIDGHRTSIRLEPDFWDAFCDIARREHKTVNQLAAEIAGRERLPNLTAAIRCFVVSFYRQAEKRARRRIVDRTLQAAE